MKFDKNGLELCGQYFKFKKCTNMQVLEYQKEIEKEQDNFKPITDKVNKLERDAEAIETEIKSIQGYVKAITMKQEPSDEELDLVAQYSMKVIDLVEQRRKLIEKAEKLDKKHKKDIENLELFVLEKYGEIASAQLEGLTTEFYMENADSVDTTIVKLLTPIKKMLALGSSNKDVEKFIKQNVNAEAKQSFRND